MAASEDKKGNDPDRHRHAMRPVKALLEQEAQVESQIISLLAQPEGSPPSLLIPSLTDGQTQQK